MCEPHCLTTRIATVGIAREVEGGTNRMLLQTPLRQPEPTGHTQVGYGDVPHEPPTGQRSAPEGLGNWRGFDGNDRL